MKDQVKPLGFDGGRFCATKLTFRALERFCNRRLSRDNQALGQPRRFFPEEL